MRIAGGTVLRPPSGIAGPASVGFALQTPAPANRIEPFRRLPHVGCSLPRLHAPFSLSGHGREGGHVKNLKDLWEKSPELLEALGGEQLVGSGFELEQPDREFATQESAKEGEE